MSRYWVAPGLRAGRGLKLKFNNAPVMVPHVAPGLRAGRGLKLESKNEIYARFR